MELTSMSRKVLPKGQFVFLSNVAVEATEQDLQELILARTGVTVPIDRITIDQPTGLHKTNRAMLSLTKRHVCELLAWALSEDSLFGLPLQVQIPTREGEPQCR